MCNFIAKGIIGGTFMIWIRWSLPRLRIDQVMTTCLKYCVPIASAMLAGVMLWCYFLPGGVMLATGRTTFDDSRASPKTVRQTAVIVAMQLRQLQLGQQ